MYENAKPELDRIVHLVQGLPESFQARAFDILLSAYASSLGVPTEGQWKETRRKPAESVAEVPGAMEGVPTEIKARLRTLAAQAKTNVGALVGLFDFTVDPFTLGSFAITGANVAEKARKVALLVAARSYLANGKWVADWAETKAACVDHGCYDGGNFAATMRDAKGGVFKSVAVGQSIELSAGGQAEAKVLLADLVTNADQ